MHALDSGLVLFKGRIILFKGTINKSGADKYMRVHECESKDCKLTTSNHSKMEKLITAVYSKQILMHSDMIITTVYYSTAKSLRLGVFKVGIELTLSLD